MLRASLWLTLLCALLYASNLGGGFVYDDTYLMVDSSRLITATPRLAFTSDYWQSKSWKAMHYRPLAMLAYSGVNYVFGLSPFAYHSTSILLNSAAAIAFLWLLMGLGFREPVCWAATILFAVHPLHVEAVAWMAGLPEVLMGALAIGSLACFAHGKRIWSLMLAAAAMLTKESALVLPVMIFAIAWQYSSEHEEHPPASRTWSYVREALMHVRTPLLSALPYGLLAIAYLVARSKLLPHPPPDAVKNTMLFGWQAIPGSFAHYMRMLFYPWPMSIHYELPGAFARFAAFAGVAIWVAAAMQIPKLREPLTISATLLFIPLAVPVITSPIMGVWLQVQDRYTYLATTGACLLVAALLDWIPWRRTLLYGCLLIAPLGALATFLQLYVWDNGEALWTHTLQVTPGSIPAALNLAYDMYFDQRYLEAEVVYRKALRYHPNDKDLLKSLSLVVGKHPATARPPARRSSTTSRTAVP